jgi:hypothetical protein
MLHRKFNERTRNRREMISRSQQIPPSVPLYGTEALIVKLRRNHCSSYGGALEPRVSRRFRELLHRNRALCAATHIMLHRYGGVIPSSAKKRPTVDLSRKGRADAYAGEFHRPCGSFMLGNWITTNVPFGSGEESSMAGFARRTIKFRAHSLQNLPVHKEPRSLRYLIVKPHCERVRLMRLPVDNFRRQCGIARASIEGEPCVAQNPHVFTQRRLLRCTLVLNKDRWD